MQLLIVNPGATSTKIAVFSDETQIWKHTVEHSAEALAPFEHVVDQFDYRKTCIETAIREAGYAPADFDAVCGRGGLLRHIPSGTYAVNDRAVYDIEHPPYGEHAASLGVLLAKALADEAGVPAYFVDPVSVDELSDVARVSGLSGMERESFFHALNQKSVARKAAGALGKPYESLRLIVVHLGGGVSVAAHDRGLVTDNFNVKDEGSFGMDRGGSLPVSAIVNLCYSGKTKQEVKKLLGTQAGVFSYLGTRDFREVEARAFSGDANAKRVFDALAYQLAKDIGAMAAVLHFSVDALVFTGGMANSRRLIDAITAYVGSLAQVLVFPGEEEMRALAEGALAVLRGEKEAKTY